jgi:3',5'-cyclic AMP phosphodiesterase CpdA
MRTIVHLSDLHFGRVDGALVAPLISVITAARPDLLVVSGDFTQRARTTQFLEAKAFLGQLPFPQLLVPGNHDIPLRDLLARFTRPLVKYRRYISEDLAPFFADAEIAVAGVNTARSLTTKYGRINASQIARLVEKFRRCGPHVTKIVVTHHPFDLPANYPDHRQLVGRSAAAMQAMAGCGVDLLLSGHLHLMHTALTAARYKIAGHSALVVQAGTAISTRGRGEVNSFNILRIAYEQIEVERILWRPETGSFTAESSAKFRRAPEGWRVEKSVAPAPSENGPAPPP